MGMHQSSVNYLSPARCATNCRPTLSLPRDLTHWIFLFTASAGGPLSAGLDSAANLTPALVFIELSLIPTCILRTASLSFIFLGTLTNALDRPAKDTEGNTLTQDRRAADGLPFVCVFGSGGICSYFSDVRHNYHPYIHYIDTALDVTRALRLDRFYLDCLSR
jgi:hypothetical protein